MLEILVGALLKLIWSHEFRASNSLPEVDAYTIKSFNSSQNAIVELREQREKGCRHVSGVNLDLARIDSELCCLKLLPPATKEYYTNTFYFVH